MTQDIKSTALLRSIPVLQEALRDVEASSTQQIETYNGYYQKIPGCDGLRQIYDPHTADGGIEFYQLREGMWLILVDTVTKQVLSSRHSLGGMLVFTAVLQANIDIPTLADTRDGSLANGHCMIYGMETDGSFETIYAPKRTLKWATVIVDPQAFFDAVPLAGQDIPDSLMGFLNEGGPIAHRNISMKREVSMVAIQMVECKFEGSYRQAFLQAKAQELLCHILSDFKESQSRQEGTVLSARDYAKVERAKKYIEHSLSDRPNIAELAYAVDLTRHKLQQGFKQLYGNTVANVREKMRLEHALKLVQRSDMSMIEIALETGYEHQASFTRAFKAAFGISPIEARRTFAPHQEKSNSKR